MASQHNSMTLGIYSLGSEERDITNMGHMTRHLSHTIKQAHAEATCLGTDTKRKKA